MKQLARPITQLPLIVLAVSCAVRPGHEPSNGNQNVSSNEEVTASNEGVTAPAAPPPPSVVPTLSVVPKENPGEYSVQISWSSVPEGATHWAIDRARNGGAREALAVVPIANASFEDVTVTQGESYTYYLHAISGTEVQGPPAQSVEQTISAAIPRDLVIEGETFASDLVGIGRLYLRNKASIVSNGKPIHIDAQEIISEEASMRTRAPKTYRLWQLPLIEPCGEPAKQNVAGEDGPPIQIHAKRAKGSLTIVGCGQNGGYGNDGPDGIEGSPGKDGNPSEWREVVTHCDSSFSGGVNCHWEKRCTKNPTDGGQGGSGSPAGPGGPGARGGNGSPIDVVIDESPDPSSLKLQVMSIPGHGGLGGRSGRPGPGGRGGAPGPIVGDNVVGCVPAKAGPTGQPGAASRAGVQGPTGRAMEPSVKVGGTQLNKGHSVSWPAQK